MIYIYIHISFILFRLFPFPTKKKNPTARDSWRKIINRNVDLKGCKLWEPSKDSRVCSKHFIDGEPSNENPYPTRNLGYDATKRTLFFSPPSTKRKSVLTEKMETYSIAKPKKRINIVKRVVGQEKGDIMKKELTSPVEPLVDETRGSEISKIDDNEVNFEVVDEQSFEQISDDKTDKKVNDVTEANIITVTGCKCSRKLLEYENKIKSLEDQLNLRLHSKILTNDKSYSFFTNFELFHKFHDILSPLVRRFRPVSQTMRQFITTPKKMGKERKLSSKNEFLLTMMKLRLGLQTVDLAFRFNVSEGSCSNIFLSWLRAMAEYFKAFVFIPNLETVLATSPDRF